MPAGGWVLVGGVPSDMCTPGDMGMCVPRAVGPGTLVPLGTWACVCPGAGNPAVPKHGAMCAPRDTPVPRDMATRTPVDMIIVSPFRVPRGLVCAWGHLQS